MAGNPSPSPPIELPPLARRLAEAVRARGGRAWIVGGTVRDALLGRKSKDVDLEVHGLSAKRLKVVLASVAPVTAVGRSFGVFKVGPGVDAIDVALPRSAVQGEEGARGEVRGAPHMGLDAACRGRDLTINAIAADALTGEVVDPTGGIDDLRLRQLRAADPSRFADDPLRVVRVARFAATLDFTPTPSLVHICRGVSLREVAAERITSELERLLVESQRPSVGLRVLQDTGAWAQVLTHLPASSAAFDAVDRARLLVTRVGPAPRNQALLWGALLASLSPDVAERQLEVLKVHRRDGFDVRAAVVASIQHRAALLHDAGVPDAVLRTLAESVECAVAIAIAEASSTSSDLAKLHQRAHDLGVLHSPLVPLLYGRDLSAIGVQRGPAMGRILRAIRSAQLRGDVDSPEAATQFAETLWTSEKARGV